MIGFATPAFISGVELPKRASPGSALANYLGTTRLQANLSELTILGPAGKQFLILRLSAAICGLIRGAGGTHLRHARERRATVQLRFCSLEVTCYLLAGGEPSVTETSDPRDELAENTKPHRPTGHLRMQDHGD